MAEPAASPTNAARRVMDARLVLSGGDITLLRGLLARRRPADRRLQLFLIGIKPFDPGVGVEGACARLPEHLGVIDTRRHSAALDETAGHGEQPAPRARDHDVAWSKMFLGMV